MIPWLTFEVASRVPCEPHGRWATVTRACLLLHPMPFQTFRPRGRFVVLSPGPSGVISGKQTMSDRMPEPSMRRPACALRVRAQGRARALRCTMVWDLLPRLGARPRGGERRSRWSPRLLGGLAGGRVRSRNRRGIPKKKSPDRQ